jgi:predicted dehydrogenase
MVRFGIVGCGGIAKKFARDLKYVEEAIITAVASLDMEKAYEYQKEYDAEHVFFNYYDMAKSDVIDAVYIALPHNMHKDTAVIFIKNQKHVLIEKPISVNEVELQEMIKVAKDNHVLLMEAMWTAFLPASTYVKKIIDNHDLGSLLEAKLSFGYKMPSDYPDKGRLINPNLAGGSLLDLGIYPVSFMNLIKQKPIANIKAKADFGDKEVDLKTVVNITDIDKSTFTLVSSLKHNLDNDALFIFQKGVIKMVNFHRCNKVYVNEYEIDLPFEGEGFVHEIRSFVSNIINKETENQIMSYNHNLETMRIVDRVRTDIGLKYPFESDIKGGI